MDFQHFLASCQQRVEQTLKQACTNRSSEFSHHDSLALTAKLSEALAYATLDGGKRVRPALVYAAARVSGADPDTSTMDAVAAAIECMHCYSLVHDDLPAMDDDELRRGRPTCHRAYNEATAILSGDALQAMAFEQLASAPRLDDGTRLALVRILAAASGPRGMVGGQFIDLAMESQSTDLPVLETLHQLKTGALIRASVALGAKAANATAEIEKALDTYARCIGLAFQVKDDLLDLESSTEALGKTQGADLARNKSTYPSLLGLEASRQHLASLYATAQQAIAPLGDNADMLAALARYIIERDH